MALFSIPDLFALTGFIVAWCAYAYLVERTPHGHESLNARIDRYREVWMRRMLARDMRMVDMQIMAAIQNGTAFFASTSLIAIGGALTLLRATDELISVVTPFGIVTSRGLWEIKTMGLTVIFAYAFFKFAWSYRLYNYVAILLGAMPPAAEKEHARGRCPCAAHGAAVRFRRPPFQPRPAGVLLRDRVSWLVRGPRRADDCNGGGRGGDLAPAIRLGFPARHASRRVTQDRGYSRFR